MRVMRFLQSMYLSSFRALIGWGDPEQKGAALQASEVSFSEAPEQIVCVFAKGAAGNLRGKPKPAGLELLREAAERGNYPEAKPNRERLKGRRADATDREFTRLVGKRRGE